MSRTIFNELGENRVINPRSGFSQFVDLSNNQTISGIKTFLNDLKVNNIKSISYIGYQPSIDLDNRFIDINNSSLDIISSYIGFVNPQQTLTTASKYMFIKPLTNGDFEMRINNETKFIMKTDISLGGVGSRMAWKWVDSSLITRAMINPNATPAYGNNDIFKFYATTIGTSIFYEVDGTLGGQTEPGEVYIWRILSNGNIITTGNITGGLITGTSLSITGGGTISTSGLINGGVITGTSLSAGTGTISTTGNITGGSLNLKNESNQNCLIITPSLSAPTYRLQLFGFPSGIKKLYYSIGDELGVIELSTTIWKINGLGDATFNSLSVVAGGTITTTGDINGGAITGTSLSITGGGTISTSGIINGGVITGTSLSAGSGTISTSGSISGVGITGRTLTLNNASAITNISLDATTTSGDRLKIYGIASGTRYLYYNTSNNIGVFNTSTGTSVWSIDGTTGNIVTIGSYSVGSLSATSFLCNSMSPLSGTVINIGATSEFNFLKSVGVSRVRIYPTSTAGDIMQITRVSDATFTSGYWYFNNIGNLGYHSGGVVVWELSNNGNMNYANRILFTPSIGVGEIAIFRTVVSGSGRWHFSTNSNFGYFNGSSHIVYIEGTSGNITCGTINCGTINAGANSITCSIIGCTNIVSTGPYNYINHSGTNDICGYWSQRTGVGGNITNNGNSWSAMIGMECNTNGNIGGGGYNTGNNVRQFVWYIENTTGSGKALGLGCNKTGGPNASINTSSQGSNYALLGFYATNRTGGAYSFTGEHSSMVCDEEYDDLMNYNTDDFLGMVVCSSGKIYNLPYDVDGNTYMKQVDNIKSVDSQPMTRLSKKYKDKSVLGVISHIEKVGKNRNDLGGTSWTGCMALDKDERRRIRIASIGEGGIWITNEYGNIENGDYITTSNIAGYSTRQDDDLLHNYTIAKATMDCDFDIEKPDEYKTKNLGDGIYASYIACTFHCG